MFLVGAVNQIWMDWWTQIWNRDEKLGTKNGKAYASAGNPEVFFYGSLVPIGTFVKPLYGKYEGSWFIKAANWFIAKRMFGGRKASQDIFHHIDLNGVRDPMTYLDYHIFTSIESLSRWFRLKLRTKPWADQRSNMPCTGTYFYAFYVVLFQWTLWSCEWCGYALRHYVHLLLSFSVCFHIFLFSLAKARYLNSLACPCIFLVEGWKIPGLQEIQVCLNVHRNHDVKPQTELVEELHLLTVLEPVRVLPSLSDEEVITIFDASWIAMFEHVLTWAQTLHSSFLAIPHCSKIWQNEGYWWWSQWSSAAALLEHTDNVASQRKLVMQWLQSWTFGFFTNGFWYPAKSLARLSWPGQCAGVLAGVGIWQAHWTTNHLKLTSRV